MSKLQATATLIMLPLFMLGLVTIAQNLFDGNLIPTLIGVGFVLISVVLCLFVIGTEQIKRLKTQTVRAKIHRAVYEYLVDKGYDTETAYRLATKVTCWS